MRNTQSKLKSIEFKTENALDRIISMLERQASADKEQQTQL